MSRFTPRITIAGACIVIAVLALTTFGLRWFFPDLFEPPLPVGARKHVPAEVVSTTLVGFHPAAPAPWPDGNCFSLAAGNRSRPGRPRMGWHVANMHSENFRELVGQLGLKSLEVENLGDRWLLVDPRVPRAWLKTRPCDTCMNGATAAALLASRPEAFRPPE